MALRVRFLFFSFLLLSFPSLGRYDATIYLFCGASARTPIWASYVVTPLSRNCKLSRYDGTVFLFCGASANTPILGNCAVYLSLIHI